MKPSVGEWTYEVNVIARDEFSRIQPLMAPCRITLIGPGGIFSGRINVGDSLCTLAGLPESGLLVTADAEGYYSLRTISRDIVYPVVRSTQYIYAIPSAESRIDSIDCLINLVTPQVSLRCLTSNVLPTDGFRGCIAFLGLAACVSPRWGDYVYAVDNIQQEPGTNRALSREFYRDLHARGIGSGSRVYVTARCATGATVYERDAATGLSRYRNIEDNSTVVVSFIMP